MGQQVIDFLNRLLGNGHELVVLFGSAIPVTEMRATIPLGILKYGMDPIWTGVLALVGSALPVPLLLLFFERFLVWIRKVRWLGWFSRFLDNRVQKNAKKVERYAEIGLIIFVGIPLPGTGLWTGSMVASFLGLDFKKSFVCVVLGGVMSALIMVGLSLMIQAGLIQLNLF
jgi:uncharacterized membrane protein